MRLIAMSASCKKCARKFIVTSTEEILHSFVGGATKTLLPDVAGPCVCGFNLDGTKETMDFDFTDVTFENMDEKTIKAAKKESYLSLKEVLDEWRIVSSAFGSVLCEERGAKINPKMTRFEAVDMNGTIFYEKSDDFSANVNDFEEEEEKFSEENNKT